MAIPNVSMSFLQNGLGIVTPGPGGAQAKIGVSLSGTPGTVYPLGTLAAAVAALGDGPLCDAVCQVLGVAGTTVYAVPCTISAAGNVTATFTQVGSGACVVSATTAPHVQVLAKCSTAGTVGTAAFQFSVNGGSYGSPVVSAGTTWVYRVPGTFLTLTFAPGSYRLADVYTCATDGTITVTSGGGSTVTGVSSPVDAYQVKVQITTAGARGVAQFTYSLDGGTSVSSPILTAATYVIPSTGIILAFTNAASVLGDVYTGQDIPPACSYTGSAGDTTIAAAFDALTASPYVIEGVHLVGTPSSAANAATLAGSADTKMTAAKLLKRYEFTVTECPTVGTPLAAGADAADTDATIVAAFPAVVSTEGRVSVCAGDCDLFSPVTGLLLRRNCAWAYTARLGAHKMSENPGKVKNGAVANVRNIYRNEEATPSLSDARFVTMRTLQGKAGYFFTDGPTMAQVASDYSTIMNVRVINRAATIANAAYTNYINDDVRMDRITGYIDERDAKGIDNDVTSQEQAALMGTPGSVTDEVSNVTTRLSRTDNLLSTSAATALVSILPKGYTRNISVSIGFVNPLVQ
jgi:hypothetical protein